MSEGKSVLREKSLLFAIESVRIYKTLESKKEYILSKQFLRSGTSVGANIREAQNAESKAAFIHKFGIAQKECDETLYWLE
jgi:four helix bundle protein